MAKKVTKKKKQTDRILSEGILLTDGFDTPREGTLSNLLVRAFFLFAIVAGSLGGMLSAFHISYAKWAFFLTALLAALYCASLYVSVWWENIGYVLLFILAMYTGLSLRTYISSGFYGILNDISASASLFFASDAQVNYVEQVENRFLTISVAMCYFALIGCTIANGLISRKSKYFAVSVPALFFLLVPIYLEHEPAAGYVILFCAGILTVYIHRQNRYACHKPNAKTLQKAGKKHILSGNFSGSAAVSALLTVTILCTITAALAGLFYPKEGAFPKKTQSAVKLKSMDTMENFYLLGVMGLINFYPSTGGLKSGRLGGVSSVRLDYETDLKLEFVPYTYDRIYLKSFTGAEYLPYENRWSIDDRTAYVESWKHDTADRLEAAFRSGAEGYAKGVLKITNVAAMTGVYLPYYSKASGVMIRPGTDTTYPFFPLLERIPEGSADPLVSGLWLDVPEENREAVAAFCKEAGLSGSPEEIVTKLRSYFQAEFPYTLSPGATPRRKDFINYFLTTKRKGYCAHYASSAVLILRYMGIPARYAEGYAVDAVEIAEDARRTEANVSDYYEGASLLPQSSVVSYDVPDASAHAWVEIYDENLGWYPVEVTPSRTDTEENQNSIWSLFASLFRSGEYPHLADIDTEDNNANPGNVIMDALQSSTSGIVFVLMLALLTAPVWLAVRRAIAWYRYRHASLNEKLLIRYRRMLRKVERKCRRHRHSDAGGGQSSLKPDMHQNADDKELRELKNFEEQAAWLSKHNVITQENLLRRLSWEEPSVLPHLSKFPIQQEKAQLEFLIHTLNEAAFSSRDISLEAFEEACRIMNDAAH